VVHRVFAARTDQPSSSAQATDGRESAARVEVAEEALGRVAHRLHAGLLQELSAMAMTVDLVREAVERGDDATPFVRQLDDILSLVVGTARGVVRDLRPSAETPQDLVFALRDLVARRAPAHTPVEVTAPTGEESPLLRLLAFRVLEAVLGVAGDGAFDVTRIDFDGPRMVLEISGHGRLDATDPALVLLGDATRALGGSLDTTRALGGSPGATGGPAPAEVHVRWCGRRDGDA
jgi:Histidine kinase